MTGSEPSLHALATDIVELLNVSNYKTTSPMFKIFQPFATVSQLEATGNRELLTALREMAVLFEAPEHTANKLTLLHSAAVQPAEVLLALNSRRDWLARNPDVFQSFHHFLVVLASAFPEQNSNTELLNVAETLSLAYREISNYEYPEESHLHGTAALKNLPFLMLLLEHFECVPELLQYRMERGLDKTPVMEAHDEEDFQRYLAQGSVRNGWL